MRPVCLIDTPLLSCILDARVGNQGEKRIYHQGFQVELTFLINTSKLVSLNIFLEPKMILFGAMNPLNTGYLYTI